MRANTHTHWWLNWFQIWEEMTCTFLIPRAPLPFKPTHGKSVSDTVIVTHCMLQLHLYRRFIIVSMRRGQSGYAPQSEQFSVSRLNNNKSVWIIYTSDLMSALRVMSPSKSFLKVNRNNQSSHRTRVNTDISFRNVN